MKITTLITLSILLLSCNNLKDRDDNLHELDMMASKEISFETLVSSVECFRLMQSEISSFWKIIEYDDFFYLLSFNSVSVYNRSGEHIRTISNPIRGRLFILNDMIVNEKENQLWILEQLENINKYSLNGQFIEQQKLPFKAVKMASAGADQFLFFHGDIDKTTHSFFRITSTEDFSTKAMFIERHNINNIIPVSTFSYNSDEIIIYLPYNDTIYVYDNKNLKIFPQWYLNFAGNFMTHQEIPQGGISDKRYAEIMKENRKYIGLRGVHFVNKFIIMRLEGKDNSFRAIDIKNNNTVYFTTLIDNIKTIPQGNTSDGLLIVMTLKDFISHYSVPENYTKYESIKELLKKIKENDIGGLIVLKIILKEDLL